MRVGQKLGHNPAPLIKSVDTYLTKISPKTRCLYSAAHLGPQLVEGKGMTEP